MQIPFALSKVHVEDITQTDCDEPCTHFSGGCAGDEGLPAAWWTEGEERGAQRFPIHLSKLRVPHRPEECHFEAAFDLFHAPNIRQPDVRDFDLMGIIGIPAIHDPDGKNVTKRLSDRSLGWRRRTGQARVERA